MKTYNDFLAEKNEGVNNIDVMLHESYNITPEQESAINTVVEQILLECNNGKSFDLILEEVMEEGLLGSIFGGLTGFALGSTIGRAVARVLGIERGVLYDLLTSRLVGAALGSSLGKQL